MYSLIVPFLKLLTLKYSFLNFNDFLFIEVNWILNEFRWHWPSDFMTGPGKKNNDLKLLYLVRGDFKSKSPFQGSFAIMVGMIIERGLENIKLKILQKEHYIAIRVGQSDNKSIKASTRCSEQ